jgi:hypothetical protein
MRDVRPAERLGPVGPVQKERKPIDMTTRVSSSSKIATVLRIAVVSTAAFAQTALTGTYVFSERGSETATLAWLMFAVDGSATGSAVRQQGLVATNYSLQGTYVTNADGSRTMTISGTGDTVNENGNPLVFNEVVMIIPTTNKEFGTLRTDAGQVVGELITALSGAFTPGSYQIGGMPVDPANTSVSLVTVDSAGSVTGQRRTNAFGQVLRKAISGTVAVTPAGFQNISLITSYTDADRNAQTVTETYLALPTQKDVRMIQTVGGVAGLLTLSQ